ncbi:glycoside hydrolase [Rickenella mellea]|uniref:Glycoside hydrolase n=1 Tax=Rickenella mellea TaxID=50990 RepID=A0A4Y7QJ56_9AGAM|nr:glycoside hydrolase [Rickenella mellea]
MILSADQVSALLSALGLTQSIFKPIPDLVGSLLAPLDGVVNTVDGITGPLGLPAISSLPIIGQILEAEPASSQSLNPTSKNPKILDTVSCEVDPYDPPPVVAQSFPPFDQAKANIYRYRQQQSVNLGSWFVHEQWMTPSLFTCANGSQASELDIASGWGSPSEAKAVLERHWDTFINQSDFQYLASIGINTVRIPIGYWSLGPLYCQGTPFEPVAEVYANAWSRVVRAINMAAEAGIGVLVDLHGAPGSQNGQAHSGTSDGVANLFNDPSNTNKTIAVLTFLVQQLATVTNVIGVELLNEPINVPQLGDFYTEAITTLRQVSPEAARFPLYIHDGFDLQRFSDFVASRSDFVVEDHHAYFVFTSSDDSEPASQHTNDIATSISDDLANAAQKQRRNLIIGEWSCALTNDSLASTPDPLAARQQFCQGQEQVYSNHTAGWSFWSYLTENCSTDLDWCFKNAVGKTLPTTFFSYKNTSVATPIQAMALAVAVSGMNLPSMTEVLGRVDTAISTSSTSMASTSIPSTSTVSVLLSPGDSQAEQSITKGYSDGFMTAKIFAQHGLSRLGFKGQYVADSVEALGPTVIAPGTEAYYIDWFYKGLEDGETSVNAATVNL